MPDLTAQAVRFGNYGLTVKEFLESLKLTRRARALFFEVFLENYMVSRARDMGLVVSDEELQVAADEFRRRQQLLTAEQTQGWLSREGLTSDDLAVGLATRPRRSVSGGEPVIANPL